MELSSITATARGHAKVTRLPQVDASVDVLAACLDFQNLSVNFKPGEEMGGACMRQHVLDCTCPKCPKPLDPLTRCPILAGDGTPRITFLE